jgi:hypothetical protein
MVDPSVAGAGRSRRSPMLRTAGAQIDTHADTKGNYSNKASGAQRTSGRSFVVPRAGMCFLKQCFTRDVLGPIDAIGFSEEDREEVLKGLSDTPEVAQDASPEATRLCPSRISLTDHPGPSK